MTFAIGENPVGESHIGELPATQSILKQQDRIENLLNSSLIYCIKPNLSMTFMIYFLFFHQQ
jgi:hypothetical protein